MRWIFVGIWFLFLSLSEIGEVSQESRAVFGVRISMGPNSQLVSFVALRYTPDGILREKRNYNRDEFIRILSGDWPSPFNPKKRNLLAENGIFGGVYYNDTIKKSYPFCPVLDSLWKIRYSDWPFRNGNERGWSKGLYRPSSSQEQYLANRYHFKQMDTEYILDTNFWRLLKDVSDSNWRFEYQSLP
jgi:hypothetical protein